MKKFEIKKVNINVENLLNIICGLQKYNLKDIIKCIDSKIISNKLS